MELECKHLETIMVHGSKKYCESTGAVSFPIYQSATFRHPGLKQSTGYDYSRTQNPTREQLEDIITKLEGGKKGFAFSTGMAAIDAVVKLFVKGEHVILSDDLYGGTYRLFQEIYKVYGVETTFVDTTDICKVSAAIRANTKAIFIETPSNPTMKVSNIAEISTLAKENKILTIVDNTFLTPYFQKPIKFGADIVIHSGTKYLGGHNDTLAGLVVVNNDELAQRLEYIQISTGAVLSPFDSWLIIRGIKTLAIRLEKQQQNAMKLAKWLKNQDAVDKVYYPGLPEHIGYNISVKQAKGFGGMLSFTVKNERTVEKILGKLKVVIFAESLGGVESLITYPYLQTHSSIPEEKRRKLGITNKLLRLSVGIENIEDLINDLDQALA